MKIKLGQDIIDIFRFKHYIWQKFNDYLIKKKENYIRYMLKYVKITNLKLLSYDIQDLQTIEHYVQNDFYYNAKLLKKYCNYNINKPLRCIIEHGTYDENFFWDCDLNTNATIILSMGDYRAKIIKQNCNKKFYSIGPYIAYAQTNLSENKIKKIKKKLGKTLVVFPTHSTHHIKTEYNIQQFCDEINRIKNTYNFKTVLVCMYWKDILHKYDKCYKNNGFTCISAGHIYDEYFYGRLKTIFSLADVTMSNDVGTYVGYSIYMKKPHYQYPQECNQIFDEGYNPDLITEYTSFKTIQKYFLTYSEEISKEQYAIINKYFSCSNIKTKEELNNIFQKADVLYNNAIAERK